MSQRCTACGADLGPIAGLAPAQASRMLSAHQRLCKSAAPLSIDDTDPYTGGWHRRRDGVLVPLKPTAPQRARALTTTPPKEEP